MGKEREEVVVMGGKGAWVRVRGLVAGWVKGGW